MLHRRRTDPNLQLVLNTTYERIITFEQIRVDQNSRLDSLQNQLTSATIEKRQFVDALHEMKMDVIQKVEAACTETVSSSHPTPPIPLHTNDAPLEAARSAVSAARSGSASSSPPPEKP